MRGVCKICGCTDSTPCLDAGEPCYWVDDTYTLCSACEQASEPLIVAATEGECSRYIRAMRAAGDLR